MKILLSLFLTAILTACAVQTAIPLGNDMMEINVSAAPVYGRAGAQRMAIEKAAQATIDAGYDKFIVMQSNAWNETGYYSGSNATGNFNQYGGGIQANQFSGTVEKPESKMVIRMYHYKDKGAEKAVDARQVLKKKVQPPSQESIN